jgi:hypothetical protein
MVDKVDTRLTRERPGMRSIPAVRSSRTGAPTTRTSFPKGFFAGVGGPAIGLVMLCFAAETRLHPVSRSRITARQEPEPSLVRPFG